MEAISRTTAAGTAYTVRKTTSTGYGTAIYVVADHVKDNPNIPTILYCHGAAGRHNNFTDGGLWTGIREWIIDNGIAFVEGSGGVTEEEGGNHWGDDNARAAYQSYLAWAETEISVGPIIPLGRSMGGLIAAWLYIQSPLSDRCAGLIVNAGVQTVAVGTLGASDPDEQPTAEFFGGFRNKYGVTGDRVTRATQAIANTLDRDPMNFPVEKWDGAKILQLGGTADTAVPPYNRGYLPLRARYAGRPAIDRAYLKPGGTHSDGEWGLYGETQIMSDFLSEVLGLAPAGGSQEGVLRVSSQSIIIGGAPELIVSRHIV